MGANIFLSQCFCCISREILRTGIVGSHVSSIFNFLRNLCAVLYSSHTNLHSYQQGMRIPFSLYPFQNLLFFVFLIIAILTTVRYCLIAVLISISLITSDVEHLSMCLLAIYMFSLKKKKKVLFRFSAYFLIQFFKFLNFELHKLFTYFRY